MANVDKALLDHILRDGVKPQYHDPNRNEYMNVPEITDNGEDYDLLEDATKLIKGVEGLTLEIGLRMGGGSKHIIDSLLANGDNNRTHIAIDPYGFMDYPYDENTLAPLAFGAPLMKKAMVAMYSYVRNKDIDFLFFPFEDEEYFRLFMGGVPVYKRGIKTIENNYALVYFDGPHTKKAVLNETRFFMDRARFGSVFVYDDVKNFYDHSVIEKFLFEEGWKKVLEASSKAAYRKEKV